MGALYQKRKSTMKEGDAPMMLYLMGGGGGDPADPTAEHWGGQFQLVAAPSFWSDIPTNDGQHHQTNGSGSISKWRQQYLGTWLQRINWLRNGSSGTCSSALDCRLNGRCTDAGVCACAPSWTGADCSRLALQPGPASGDLRLPNVSTWGMGTVYHGSQWHGYFAEMEDHCGLTSWETNSLIAHAVASTPGGPWQRVGRTTGVWAHNPSPMVAPDDGTLLIFHIGTGTQNSKVSRHRRCQLLGRCVCNCLGTQ